MPIVSNSQCKEMFQRAGRNEVIPEIFMCAGYDGGGRDSCQVKHSNGFRFCADKILGEVDLG